MESFLSTLPHYIPILSHGFYYFYFFWLPPGTGHFACVGFPRGFIRVQSRDGARQGTLAHASLDATRLLPRRSRGTSIALRISNIVIQTVAVPFSPFGYPPDPHLSHPQIAAASAPAGTGVVSMGRQRSRVATLGLLGVSHSHDSRPIERARGLAGSPAWSPERQTEHGSERSPDPLLGHHTLGRSPEGPLQENYPSSPRDLGSHKYDRHANLAIVDGVALRSALSESLVDRVLAGGVSVAGSAGQGPTVFRRSAKHMMA